ncbi:hypothetical protein BIFGAL_04287 [Bifidobacterium gallicum DSM 20093 = LMG 11596]|uniref:Uncharacterized protein n=1 Tax=Bifidobacterium gallicum DSM 20093 = LMG 11596 TaxID=561180 RepID=D1NWN3_9BIFI|nr:hypothetical protein BIFGAL_04287 [Bifidobacterium gallicum DSM 20093 = LMG 11596]
MVIDHVRSWVFKYTINRYPAKWFNTLYDRVVAWVLQSCVYAAFTKRMESLQEHEARQDLPKA